MRPTLEQRITWSAMIFLLSMANYRSTGPLVELTLSNLTTLVGLNGAGKSNVLDALGFLGDALRQGLEAAVADRQGTAAIGRWTDKNPFAVRLLIDGDIAGEQRVWSFEMWADARDGFRVVEEIVWAAPMPPRPPFKSPLRLPEAGAWQTAGPSLRRHQAGVPALDVSSEALGEFQFVDGSWLKPPSPEMTFVPRPRSLVLPEVAKLDARFRPLVDELSRIAVYSLFPLTLRQPQNLDPTHPMRRHGENWASTLRALDRERQGAELIAALGRIVGDIDDYRVTAVGGFLIPEFRHGVQNGRERWFGAAQESDGTLRIAALLTALLQEPPPSLIGIEEPELAVHPGALPILVDYLKEASQRTQVVITTHSPELLDLLPPESLRVVERVDGATTVRDLAADQKELLRKHLYSTSDLLRAEGLRGEPDGGEASEGEAGDGQGLSRR